MNEANEMLSAIKIKKAIYKKCLKKLEKDIDELSKEEIYWLGQLDEELEIDSGTEKI